MTKSYLEWILEQDLRREGIPFEREVKLIDRRRFSFDFVFPEHKLIVEIEGGTWQESRHTTGAGFQKDCIKYNEATIHGWSVLRFTNTMVSGDKKIEPAWKTIKRFMKRRDERGQEAHPSAEGEGAQG